MAEVCAGCSIPPEAADLMDYAIGCMVKSDLAQGFGGCLASGQEGCAFKFAPRGRVSLG